MSKFRQIGGIRENFSENCNFPIFSNCLRRNSCILSSALQRSDHVFQRSHFKWGVCSSHNVYPWCNIVREFDEQTALLKTFKTERRSYSGQGFRRICPSHLYAKRQISKGFRKDDNQIRILGELDSLHTELYDEPNCESLAADLLSARRNAHKKRQEVELLQSRKTKKEGTGVVDAKKGISPGEDEHGIDMTSRAATQTHVGRGGIYIYGPAGAGKSMLMENFYDASRNYHVKNHVKRLHFHEMLYFLNRKLHALSKSHWTQKSSAGELSTGTYNLLKNGAIVDELFFKDEGENHNRYQDALSKGEFVTVSRATVEIHSLNREATRIDREIAELVEELKQLEADSESQSQAADTGAGHSSTQVDIEVDTKRDVVPHNSVTVIPQPVLCLDEMHIATIQDCVVITAFLQALFDQGVVVIFTSNRHPSQLFERGRNREVYIPKLVAELERSNVKVLELGTNDYRVQAYRDQFQQVEKKDVETEHGAKGGIVDNRSENTTVDTRSTESSVSLSQTSQSMLFFRTDEQVAANEYLKSQGIPAISIQNSSAGWSETSVEIAFGRTMKVFVVPTCYLASTPLVCKLSFKQICEEALSADDYNHICSEFPVIIFTGLRELKENEHNICKRFTNFIDCCYNHHIKLVFVDVKSPSETQVVSSTQVDSSNQSKTNLKSGSINDLKFSNLFQHIVPLEYLTLVELMKDDVSSGEGENCEQKKTKRDIESVVQAVEGTELGMIEKEYAGTYDLKGSRKELAATLVRDMKEKAEQKKAGRGESRELESNGKLEGKSGDMSHEDGSARDGSVKDYEDIILDTQGSMQGKPSVFERVFRIFTGTSGGSQGSKKDDDPSYRPPHIIGGEDGPSARLFSKVKNEDLKLAGHNIGSFEDLKRMKKKDNDSLKKDSHPIMTEEPTTPTFMRSQSGQYSTPTSGMSLQDLMRIKSGIKHESSNSLGQRQDTQFTIDQTKPGGIPGGSSSKTSIHYDDTQEENVRGVLLAAIDSLHETGFAIHRAISRLHEMQTSKYLEEHRERHKGRYG